MERKDNFFLCLLLHEGYIQTIPRFRKLIFMKNHKI